MLYECDPSKNTRCTKKLCAYNTASANPVCCNTTLAEYAKLDENGKPILAKEQPPTK